MIKWYNYKVDWVRLGIALGQLGFLITIVLLYLIKRRII